MKWQGLSCVPGPSDTVKVPFNVPLDSKPWNGCKQRREGSCVATLNIRHTVAADEKSSPTITGMLAWTRRWKLLATTAHWLWAFQSRQTPNRRTPVQSLAEKPLKCVESARSTLACASVWFVFKALGGGQAHQVLKDWSHPMWGHWCSSTPSARPFLDPSALSAPPPATSLSFCFPERQNNTL